MLMGSQAGWASFLAVSAAGAALGWCSVRADSSKHRPEPGGHGRPAVPQSADPAARVSVLGALSRHPPRSRQGTVDPGDHTEAQALAADCWPVPAVAETVNVDELGDLGLTPDEEADIVVFMKTLSDGYLPESRGPGSPHFRLVRFRQYASHCEGESWGESPTLFARGVPGTRAIQRVQALCGPGPRGPQAGARVSAVVLAQFRHPTGGDTNGRCPNVADA